MPKPTQNNLVLDLTPGLAASSTARAAVVRSFADSLRPDQLLDLRLAVHSLISKSMGSNDPGPIELRVWMDGRTPRGTVTDTGGAAAALDRDRTRRSKFQILSAVTRHWDTDGATVSFSI